MAGRLSFDDGNAGSPPPTPRRVLYARDATIRVFVGLTSEYDPRVGEDVEQWVAILRYQPDRKNHRDRGGVNAAEREVLFAGPDPAAAIARAARFVEVNGESILAEIAGDVHGRTS